MIRSPLLNEFMTLRNSIDQLAEDTFRDPFRTLWSQSDNNGGKVAQPMPLDVYATDDKVVIIASVPGMNPDELQLTVQQNTVTLSGSLGRVVDTEDAKGATWYIHELGSGQYRRSVSLPFAVDADKADATFEHGMLRVVLPKAEESKPRKIAINSGRHEAIESGKK